MLIIDILFFLYLSKEGGSLLRETVSVPVEKAYKTSPKFYCRKKPSRAYLK